MFVSSALGAMAAGGLAAGAGAGSSILGSLGSVGMGSAVGGLLSGAGSLIGGLLGASSSAEMAHEQRKTMREYMKKQAEENQKQRDWSEQMSNTAHQREVTDLRAAGLNPILSATGGSGASTPSTSSNILGANDSSAQIEAQGKLALANMIANLGNQLSQIDLNSAYASKARADAGLSVANTRFADVNTAYRANENRILQPQADAVEFGTEEAKKFMENHGNDFLNRWFNDSLDLYRHSAEGKPGVIDGIKNWFGMYNPDSDPNDGKGMSRAKLIKGELNSWYKDKVSWRFYNPKTNMSYGKYENSGIWFKTEGDMLK